MDFDINNYLDFDSNMSYSELNVLLKNNRHENKEKFIKGYLQHLEKDAKNLYKKYSYLVYKYEFEDFFNDSILLMYDLYDYQSVSCDSDDKFMNVNKFRWILNNYMTRMLMAYDANFNKNKNELKKKFFALCDMLGTIPNIDEISNLLGISHKESLELLNTIYKFNIDDIEYVYDSPEDIIIDDERKKEIKENITGALGLLSESNCEVLRRKYGIISDNELNYFFDDAKKDTAIAKELGMSRQNFYHKKEVSLALIKKSSYGEKLKKLYYGK